LCSSPASGAGISTFVLLPIDTRMASALPALPRRRFMGNTAANAGSVNAPQATRDFSFVLSDKDANTLVDEIEAFQEGKSADLPWRVPLGQGMLTIRNLRLGNLVAGSRAWIESIDFTISLRLP